jgi:hypothetical protein
MKKRMIILALACFLVKKSPAMLEEILLDDTDTKKSKTDLVNLAEKKQWATPSCDKEINCCALLDCLFGLFDNNSKPELSFVKMNGKDVIPSK